MCSHVCALEHICICVCIAHVCVHVSLNAHGDTCLCVCLLALARELVLMRHDPGLDPPSGMAWA